VIGGLLLRGLLVGAIAGLACFGLFRIVGEPWVDRAIAFEDAHTHAGHKAGMAQPEAEPELVSRKVQAGIGLFTGVMVYSTAFGGLFALAFALAHGRLGVFGPRVTAGILALVGAVAISIVPAVKYPANPPAVGDAATIGTRTALYFSMLALSLAAAIAAGMLQARLRRRLGGWDATVVAAAAYVVVMTVIGLALPAVNEVPRDFPASVLWHFRVVSLAGQLMLWTVTGLLFGALAERAGGRRGLRRHTV
jgi:hypothetical protein